MEFLAEVEKFITQLGEIVDAIFGLVNDIMAKIDALNKEEA